MARNFRRGFRRRTSRPCEWIAGADWGVPALLVAGTTVSFNLAGATGGTFQFDPPVVNRFRVDTVRGDISWTMVGAVTDVIQIAVGILVVQDLSAIPNPLAVANAGKPWLWYRQHLAIQSGFIGQWAPMGGFVSTRTRRILRQGDQLLLIARYAATVGAPAVRFNHGLRTLISRVA